MSFYHVNDVVTMQFMLNFLIGGRQIGKTYSSKKFLIQQYLKDPEKKKFVWMRRTAEQVKRQRQKSWIGPVADEFPDYRFMQKTDELFIATEFNSSGEPIWEHMGTVLPLSTFGNLKGSEYDDYQYLVYDEWMPEKRNEWLTNEPEKFLNAFHSIFRGREGCQGFLLGNSTKLHNNPYFEYFDIFPSIISRYTKYRRKDMSGIKRNAFLVELIPTEQYSKQAYTSTFGALINGTQYAEMAMHNKFADDHDKLVEERPKDRIYCKGVFLHNGTDYGLWISRDNRKLYISEKFDPDTKHKYALTPDDISETHGSYKDFSKSPLAELILTARQDNNIRFETAKVREDLLHTFSKIAIL